MEWFERGYKAKEKVLAIQIKLKKLSPDRPSELIELVIDLTEALNETLDELHKVDKISRRGER